ncbi:ubiquitin carboxyl-terminal hydrolase [Anaeramoeba flamelloides]|uniref:Ubiquitin carboxyl-terminal hydrolase n=1 Tax=Anaeramoeba flamelloides TaxID=1746091 RepID=A0AAV7YDZ4_9EUKA|nr:ubiquitin carboxyl-terminal hydrolase [Anaeramoeba flamelloides]
MQFANKKEKSEEKEKNKFLNLGLVGLSNFGNTCFLNSGLQCLLNCIPLVKFFLTQEYLDQINYENVIGTNGKLVKIFGELVNNYWSNNKNQGEKVLSPLELKNLIVKFSNRFSGFDQEDSQEFLSFLLDGLHEDLNRIKKKTYTHKVEDRGRTDEVVAKESWETYKKRNDSIIVDIFTGQLKSKLRCNICKKISVTFDPFIFLSLPFPSSKYWELVIKVKYLDPKKQPRLVFIKTRINQGLKGVLLKLSGITGIKPNKIVLSRYEYNCIEEMYLTDQQLFEIGFHTKLIAFEIENENSSFYFESILYNNNNETEYINNNNCGINDDDGGDENIKEDEDDEEEEREKKEIQYYQIQVVFRKLERIKQTNPLILNEKNFLIPFILNLKSGNISYFELYEKINKIISNYINFQNLPSEKEKLKNLRIWEKCKEMKRGKRKQTNYDIYKIDYNYVEKKNDEECNNDDDKSNTKKIFNEKYYDIFQRWKFRGNVYDHFFKIVKLNVYASVVLEEYNENSIININPDLVIGIRLNPNFWLQENSIFNMKKMTLIIKDDSYLKYLKRCKQNVNLLNFGTDSKLNHEKEKNNENDKDKEKNNKEKKKENGKNEKEKEKQNKKVEDEKQKNIYEKKRNKTEKSNKTENKNKFENEKEEDNKQVEWEKEINNLQKFRNNEFTKIFIDECLKKFFKEEQLSNQDKWYCNNCKMHVCAWKKFDLWKIPQILIIHLKRFKRNLRTKNHQFVDFPSELNLSKWSIAQSRKKSNYELIAISNHYGELCGGHYTSYVKNCITDDWYEFNDSSVEKIHNTNNIITNSAYLLFYQLKSERKNLEIINKILKNRVF